MIINYLDIVSVVIDPPETNAPPVVDPNTHLPGALALERFESVPQWVSQVLDRA
jgi:hypothetical protein